MIKLLLEFGPIIVFFATYKYSNIFFATFLMVAVTTISLIISYLIDKKISLPLLISGVILLISGGITLISGDSRFIKMKPTIVYIMFTCILCFAALRKKPILKQLLGAIVDMKDEYWITLSKRFAFYFFIMAVTNELVWRNYSEEFWVNFKVFGAVPITAIFMATQIPFIKKNSHIKTR
jgi:intracellular septation protein